MTHGMYPFYPKNNGGRAELEKLILSRNIVFNNPSVSEDCKRFIDKTLQVDPNQRITWEQMFDEPWLIPCTDSSYSKNVIQKYLKGYTYQETHLNNQFAIRFGFELIRYVESFIENQCHVLSRIYSLIISKDNLNKD